MKDREFLMWLHERLEHVHKENPLFDYMHKLRAIIYSIPEYHDSSLHRGQNSLDELKKSLIALDEFNKPQSKEDTEKELREAGFSRCENCDELAWDGRICHACGAKNI